jgi:hypothetical protein
MINEERVIEAFKIFSKLNASGQLLRDEATEYFSDDTVRGLLSQFAEEVDCTVITAGEYLYMIPLTKNSIYHISNSDIKRQYMPNRALNIDIYLMYVTIIIFIGEFYDSYQTNNTTRDFIAIDDWLLSVNNRIENMKQIDEELLRDLEEEHEYNWLGIIKNWDAMDNINENAKKQTARIVSRVSFMMIVKNFLISEDLAVEVGKDELALTEKTKVIVQRYFMEYEYNRGILEVIYELENEKENI